ncbi:DUF3299 domain-containing protein [Ekhidna sp.]
MKKRAVDIVWISSFVFIVTLIYAIYQVKIFNEAEQSQELPTIDYWQEFAKVTKERKYIEEASAYYLFPVFTEELVKLSGKEVTLSGYYLPYSKLESAIILSRFPNANCFFCGRAGIESVAMIELEGRASNFRMDQRLTVKGKLMLNNSNVNKLAFVLEEASVVEL